MHAGKLRMHSRPTKTKGRILRASFDSYRLSLGVHSSRRWIASAADFHRISARKRASSIVIQALFLLVRRASP